MKKLILSVLLILSSLALQAEPFQVDFSTPAVTISNPQEISVKICAGGVGYNKSYGNSWIMGYRGASFIEITFTNNFPEGEIAVLDLFHLSSMIGQSNYSPITIFLNGQEIIREFSPAHGFYYHNDSFDLSPFVKGGKNKLHISLDKTGYSSYWLQKLEIRFPKTPPINI